MKKHVKVIRAHKRGSKRLITLCIVVAVVMMALLGLTVMATETESTPIRMKDITDELYNVNTNFIVEDAEDLQAFSTFFNEKTDWDFSGKTVTQTNDIVLNSEEVENWENWDENTEGLERWVTIGATNHAFAGTFDGGNHTVSGVYILTKNIGYQGLFASSTGVIKNVGVINSYIKGGKYTGAICGYNNGSITDCYSSAVISGNSIGAFGGICGRNENGTVENCYNTGKIITVSFNTGSIGGICGDSVDGPIRYCYNLGEIYGNGSTSASIKIGGICGETYGDIMEYCYNTGKITSTDGNEVYTGGICGNNSYTVIRYCYNKGELDGSKVTAVYTNIGGICGIINDGTVEYCYNRGNVSAKNGHVGGIIGYCNEDNEIITTIRCCYSTGGVTQTNVASREIGGIVGSKSSASCVISYCFYNNEQCSYGAVNCADDETNNVNGFSRAEMQSTAFYDLINSGGDADALILFTPDYANENDGYPVISAYDFLKGADGSEANPYIIDTAAKMYYFASLVNSGTDFSGKYIRLDKDVKLNDTSNVSQWSTAAPAYTWTPIGAGEATAFKGTFDGNYHSVSGLYYNGGNSYVGLFGYNAGSISRVAVKDSYLKGEQYVGGICGYNYFGTITCCSNAGEISGNTYIGGVCGYHVGTVENCYNTGKLSGNSIVGGVCGYIDGLNRPTVTKNCYNVGEVRGEFWVGGVSGDNKPTVQNCYYLYGCAIDGRGKIQNGTGYKNPGYAFSDFSQDDYISKNAEQFASGEVAYMLKENRTDGVWYQNLSDGGDASPVLIGNGTNTVYGEQHRNCSGKIVLRQAYANTPLGESTREDHVFVNGFCPVCDALDLPVYEEAVLNFGADGQEGTADDYYEISNAGQLYWFSEAINFSWIDIDANAVLTDDIYVNPGYTFTFEEESGCVRVEYNGVLSGYLGLGVRGTVTNTQNAMAMGARQHVGDELSIFDIRRWQAIGVVLKYAGIFDGNHHSINGLFGDSVTLNNIGLFGYAEYDSSIINLTVENSYLLGDKIVGGLCGEAGGLIANCHSSAIVGGNHDVGGLCGSVYGGMRNCEFSGTVRGLDSCGGLAGSNTEGEYLNCITTGKVLGREHFGALIGSHTYGSATENCYYIDTCGAAGVGTPVTAAQLASGEVAWLLNTNGGKSQNSKVWAQGEKRPVLANADTPVYYSASLNMESNISMNYYVNKVDGQDAPVLRIYDMDGNYITTITATDGTGVNTGKWRYTFSGVSAKEVADRYIALCTNGDSPAAVLVYGVKDYCYNQLNKTDSSDALKTLCADLLNYASVAQTYFGYKTDSLANTDMTDDMKAYATKDVPELTNSYALTDTINDANEKATFYSASLLLNEKVSIRYKLTIAENSGLKAENTRLSVRIDGGAVQYLSGFLDSNGRLCFTLDTLNARDMSKIVTVHLEYDDGNGYVAVSETLTYSIESYASRVNKNSEKLELKDIVIAMIKYGNSTSAYFDSQNI